MIIKIAVFILGTYSVSSFAPRVLFQPLAATTLSSNSSSKPKCFRLSMVGSQSTSSRDLPTYMSKKQKFLEEKQRKIDQINHKIEVVEARRIGLAKKIALAELEKDRLKLEARKIILMESEEGSSNSDLLNMTEKASAKVAAFLDESRKALVTVEAERCKLLDEANNCAVEIDDSADASSILGPASVFGGLMLAAVGLRMSLQSREVHQDVSVDNGSKKGQDTKNKSDSQTYFNRDDGRIQVDYADSQQVPATPEVDTTATDIEGLLDDLQQSFDEAIREANENKSNRPSGEAATPVQGSSFSWEKTDELILEETTSVSSDNTMKKINQDTNPIDSTTTLKDSYEEKLLSDASLKEFPKVSPILSLEQAKIDQIDIPSVEIQKNIIKQSSLNGMTERTRPLCNIKILGVGDSGAYSICRILNESVPPNVEIWALDCDVLSLQKSMEKGANVLVLGRSVTEGRGTNGLPEVGGYAAEDSEEQIGLLVDDSDVCIITAGLGSGTGSGAAPVLCRISKESGAMTIAVVTKPFPFEGSKNMRNADDAIDRLKDVADAVIVISNRNVLKIIPDDLSLEASFQIIDEIVNQVVLSIVDMLSKQGIFTADFADVRSVLKGGGIALIGMGFGSGERAAKDAAMATMTSPLLDSTLNEATGILVNIVGGKSLSLQKIDEALRVIQNNSDQHANIVMSAHLNNEYPADSVSITLLATSFKKDLITRNIRDYISESRA